VFTVGLTPTQQHSGEASPEIRHDLGRDPGRIYDVPCRAKLPRVIGKATKILVVHPPFGIIAEIFARFVPADGAVMPPALAAQVEFEDVGKTDKGGFEKISTSLCY
jgi:hypothetical protein